MRASLSASSPTLCRLAGPAPARKASSGARLISPLMAAAGALSRASSPAAVSAGRRVRTVAHSASSYRCTTERTNRSRRPGGGGSMPSDRHRSCAGDQQPVRSMLERGYLAVEPVREGLDIVQRGFAKAAGIADLAPAIPDAGLPPAGGG